MSRAQSHGSACVRIPGYSVVPGTCRGAVAPTREALVAICWSKRRWGDDHHGARGPVADDDEAVRPVTRNEHEVPGRRRPWRAIADTVQLALQQVEHLVLAGVDVHRHGQAGRIAALHDGKLTTGVLPRCLDHDPCAVEVVRVAV